MFQRLLVLDSGAGLQGGVYAGGRSSALRSLASQAGRRRLESGRQLSGSFPRWHFRAVGVFRARGITNRVWTVDDIVSMMDETSPSVT